MEETPSVISQLKHILHLAVVQICKNFVIYHKTLALRGSIVLSADDQELCVISFDEFIYSANDIIFFESVNSDSKRGVETTEAMSDVQAKKNTISMVSEPKHALSSFTSESHKFKKRSISNQFLQFKEHGKKDEQNLRLFCCPKCHKEFTFYKTYIRHQRNFHNKSASRKKKKLDCIEIVPEATRCGIVFEGDSGLDASSLLENGCNSLNSNKFYGCIDHHADTDVYGKMNLQYNTADCNMKSQDDFKKVQRIYLSIEDIMCSTGSQDNDSSFGIPKQNGVDSGVLTTDAFHDDVHSDKSAEISWSDDDVQGSLLNVEDLETMTSPGGMDNPPGLSSDGEIMAMPFCDNFELNNFMRRNPANILDRSRQDSFLEHNRPDSILDQSRPNNILEYESSFVNGCFQGCLNQCKSDNEDGPICKSNDHLKQSASSENFPESIPEESSILASDQIKKFECSLCNASFSLSNNLRRHVKKAHGANEYRKPAISASVKKLEEKVLIVPFPPKTKPSSTEKHIVRNSQSSRSRYRHVCHVCGVAFTFRTHLTRHSKKIHGQMPADTEDKMSPS